jgi:hypothetical protein
MLPTSRRTILVGAGVEAAGDGAGAVVQAYNNEASAAPPTSAALRCNSTRRVDPDRGRFVSGAEASGGMCSRPY